ncbi:MAG: PEP-CTERM sorting domain-containing protein, partial [Verrucomicrobium sp.]
FGLVVAEYDADVNERLNGSANFIGDGYDWSGVGQTSDGRWVTMISDQYFISVNHLSPVGASPVRFYTGNSAAVFEDYTVDSTYGIQLNTPQGLSDIWIGRLTTAVSSNIASYDIFDPGGDPNTLEGETVFTVGISLAGNFLNFRVGENVLDLGGGGLGVDIRTQPEFPAGYSGWSSTMTYSGLPGDTQFQLGDSGGPTFIINNGFLELVGVHSLVSDFDPTPGDISIDSLVAGYRQEILAIITPVPEPGSVVLLMLAGCGWALRRRRRETH